jgi:hypothetical protein
MIRIALIVGVFVCLSVPAAAGDIRVPRITRADVDWRNAAAGLSALTPLQAVQASAGAPAASSDFSRLNAATVERLPGIDRSSVPVLLPFDVETYLRDHNASHLADDPAYFFGFGRAPFINAGPAGYDAVFRFRPAAVADHGDIDFGGTADVWISGSLLTYELDPPASDNSKGVPALDADFPGIRRSYLENHLRYTFVRFGVPYVVSTLCYDGRARYRSMGCRDADRVLQRVIKSLHVAGGTPQATPQSVVPGPPTRPAAVSPTFTYYGPGRLLPGTGFHQGSGRADYTAYANIRFPLAEAPAFANTQYRKSRVAGGVLRYPWRDNFCERRSFYVDQCPGGLGHQGQDIHAADCSKRSLGDDRCTTHENDVVAAHDGMIMRALGQEAVYLVVNTPTDHIRFRYLHMRPKLLDADGVLSGRKVAGGEIIGQVGNYSGHENGTSYHLHFDVQVPTRSGWVFVNPYMTLVAAYERLIGGRGQELSNDVVASVPTAAGDAPSAITITSIRQAILAPTEAATGDRCVRRHRHHGHGCGERQTRSVRYGHRAHSVEFRPRYHHRHGW